MAGNGDRSSATQLPRTTPRYSSLQHRLIHEGVGASHQNSAGTRTLLATSCGGNDASRTQRMQTNTSNLPLYQSPTARCQTSQTREAAALPVWPGLPLGYSTCPAQTPAPYHLYGSPLVPMTKMRTPAPRRSCPSPVPDRSSRQTPASPCLVRPVSSHPGVYGTLQPAGGPLAGPCGVGSPSQFARVSQTLSTPSRCTPVGEMKQFPTNFTALMRANPPPLPAVVCRSAGVQTTQAGAAAAGKVRVILRVSGIESGTDTCLSVDSQRKQIILRDPTPTLAAVPASYRQRFGPASPKVFTFDDIFTPLDILGDLCASSLAEVLHGVINGSDGCVFAFGQPRIGKTYTMIGLDDSPRDMGVIPCAIAWLYQLINSQKEATGARFSVRVSAIELTGQNENLRDLLSDQVSRADASGATLASLCIRDDPVSGVHLENQSEVRAPSVDVAAQLLDAAIAARTVPVTDEDARHSHLIFTLNVYQYRVETSRQGQNSVAGGRSRLHFVDLGSCGKGRENLFSLSSLGMVITALLSGQRQVPYREKKLTQLMCESLGGTACNTCAIVHVTPSVHSYNDTFQVMQLASRMHQTKLRRRSKCSSSSEESSCDGSSGISQHWYGRRRAGVKMGVRHSYRMTHSDPECVSGSEQSCDTVIYIGSDNGRLPLSDRELTDSETGSSVVAAHPVKFDRRSVPITSPMQLTSQRGSRLVGTQPNVGDTSPPCGAQTPPHNSTSQSTRRLPLSKYPRTSSSHRCPATILEHPDEEQWIDGPRVNSPVPDSNSKSHDGLNRSLHIRSHSKVAGPELWVDGPPEFRTHDESPMICDSNTACWNKTDLSCMPSNSTSTNSQPANPTERKSGHQTSAAVDVLPTSTESRSRGLKSGTKRSSPQAKHLPRSVLAPLDGRISAWVQSVQEAALASGSLTESDLEPELYNVDSICPDGCDTKTENKTVTFVPSGLNVEQNNKYIVDSEDTCSAADDVNQTTAGNHSVYELQMDECLETGSMCCAAVASSDDDTSVWDTVVNSNTPVPPVTDRNCDGVPDGQAADCSFNEVFDTTILHVNMTPEHVEKSTLGTEKQVSRSHDTSQRSECKISALPVRIKTHPEECATRVSSISSIAEASVESGRRSSSSPRRMTSTPKRSSCTGSRSASSETKQIRPQARSSSVASSIDEVSTSLKKISAHSTSAIDEVTREHRESRDRTSSTKLQKRNLCGKSATLKPAVVEKQPASEKVISSLKSLSKDRKSRLPLAFSLDRSRSSRAASPDSGVVTDHHVRTPEHRLLSPYHAITRPRRAIVCSASSDNSSLLSDPVALSKSSEVEVSSGYESMLRDDCEESTTPSSSTQETPSDCSPKIRLKVFRKKAAINKYHHSSPFRRLTHVVEGAVVSGDAIKTRGIWLENKQGIQPVTSISQSAESSPMDEDEPSDEQQRQEAEAEAVLRRIQHVDTLLERQQVLRAELIRIKSLLAVDPAKWSVDLPVAESDGDRADPDFLHSLELETALLERRVHVCQSRIMIVTCFDSAV